MFRTRVAFIVVRFAVNAWIMLIATILMPSVEGQGNAPTAILTLSPYQLSFYMRGHAKVLGDRLFKPGNERVTLTGALTLPGQSATPVTILYDISGKIRVDQPGRSVGFDGANTWANTGAAAQIETEFLEALVNDSPEHLFTGQAERLATRFLGRAFRFDDGKATNYRGPYYDVFAVVDTVLGSKEPQLRIYCINSRTYVLERVQQDTLRAGQKVRMETVLGGWQSFGTQQFPTSVTRSQDGQQILSLTVSSAATGPAVADGRLDAPKP